QSSVYVSPLTLPLTPRELDPALRDPDAGLRAQKRILGVGPLAAHALVGPEFPELRPQGIREGDVARTAARGDRGANPNAGPRRAVGSVDVADVEADELG